MVTEDPNGANFKLPELSLPSNLNRGRLENRRALQKLIDRQSKLHEFSSKAAGLNAYYEKALAMLQTPKVRQAFDLSQEPTWTESWVAGALDAVFLVMAERGLGTVALPPLGAAHGRLPPTRFTDLLRAALERSSRLPDRIEIVGGDIARPAPWAQEWNASALPLPRTM